MGKKDIAEKILADYNDVFADIVNVLMFQGGHIVDEESLENTKDKSQYKADGKLHEQERDVSKIVKNHEVRIAFVGFENQTKIDKDMPFRVIGYDGASYRAQVQPKKKERYPVVTLVLYFGTKHWNKPLSLMEALNVQDEWKPFVNDYKVNLVEVAFLEQETINMFKNDFKIVADYFVQKRLKKDYVPSTETITHVDEMLKLMSVLTGDTRYEEVQSQKEGGVNNMCEILDAVEARGEARGETRGEVKAYLKMGLSPSEIVEKVDATEKEVQDIISSLALEPLKA